MSLIQCSRCLKTFKYNYLLIKHSNRKNICKIINDDTHENNNIIKSIEEKKEIDFEEFVNLIRIHMKDYKLLSCILDSFENKIKKKVSQNNINSLEMVKESNINVNSNNVNSNNVVVNNSFVVYPVGCESIDHIDIEKFKNIKSNKDYIPYIARCLQKYDKNLNFTKQNMNKPYVTILNSEMMLEDVPETDFYTNYLINTERKTVELIYFNKNKLTKEEMIIIFRKFLADQNLCKLSEKDRNKKLSLLKAITHRTLRSKSVYNKLSKIDLETRNGCNNFLIENLKKLRKDQCIILNESRIDPSKRNKKLIEGTDLSKNLYNIITEAEEQNKVSDDKIIKETYNLSLDADIEDLDLEKLI